jgi:hypothetical protein
MKRLKLPDAPANQTGPVKAWTEPVLTGVLVAVKVQCSCFKMCRAPAFFNLPRSFGTDCSRRLPHLGSQRLLPLRLGEALVMEVSVAIPSNYSGLDSETDQY